MMPKERSSKDETPHGVINLNGVKRYRAALGAKPGSTFLEAFMLVLSRKLGECIVIGNDVRITVIELRGNRVRLGIDAPRDQDVKRLELVDPEDAEQTEADVRYGREED